MILRGKVKKGLGDASFWVRKIEDIFYKKTNMKLFYGTLNIKLEEPYELKNYWIIKKEEYGGNQDVYVQECKILGKQAYIVRAEKTAHTSNIIEIVSDVKLREDFNLKDDDNIKIEI